jgi:uncharacterized repeat protein (TIGR03837 family)
MAPAASKPVWDIFCKVVDNFGDAGVCWRIAALLHQEHSLAVRLWIDRPQILKALRPDLDADASRQQLDGVEVIDWSRIKPDPASANVVIEAFGCGVPDDYVTAMAGLPLPPLWIVLDYLSAESWVDTHHGLASPHPSLALPRWYFYPGFTAATGGLPRERDLLSRRDAFDAQARAGFFHESGMTAPDAAVLTVSLFAYADAPVTDLLSALAEDSSPTLLLVPAGAVVPAVQAFFGTTADQARRGNLEVRLLPFLPQSRYDQLLWACDLNFVRGEDSFVRAQWAGKPMVWQPYRQDDGVHQRKLEAFIQRYTAEFEPATVVAVAAFTAAWSAGTPVRDLWPALRAARGDWARNALGWSRKLADLGEMSAKLVEFVRNKVK